MAVNKVSDVYYEEAINDRVIFGEYEGLAIGARKTYSACSLPKEASSEYCARILRKIFEVYKPEWSHTDVRDCLTPELATYMGLWPLIRHLPCPEELDPMKDLYYVAWVLYPETKNVSEIDLIARVYESIINGRRQKFPKGYFYGKRGILRARVIFKLFMNEFVIPQYDLTCLRDTYEVFGSNGIDRLIEKCHLTAFVRDRFGLPLNFLHTCLGADADDVAYYQQFFGKSQKGKRSVCLLDSCRVRKLNGGTLPKEYIAYMKYQERQEKEKQEQHDKRIIQKFLQEEGEKKNADCTE